MFAAACPECFQSVINIRHLFANQQGFEINGAQFVFFRLREAFLAHADQGDFIRALFPDIIRNGFGVYKTARDDFFRVDGIDNALGSSACGMNDPMVTSGFIISYLSFYFNITPRHRQVIP